MTPDRWTRIKALFSDAADRPPADRAAFLDREARTPDGAPDDALRAEVEALLRADAAEGGVLDAAPGRVPPPDVEVGPWRLIERVGEGGMGEVWRAERADGAYEQTAAVKLVRPGLAPDLLARFRAERQILAELDHPAIARLLDGGTASDGRPYLALEFVDGEPITASCDRRRMGVDARLALFGQVCEAVAAAHRRLVVHRDLKPSNVLVTEAGQVKLLDFGIAKLLGAEGAAQTVAERRVMTPEYAAPEQVRGEPVTTATDVYGLGVLLYELLTGARPYRLESRARRAVEQAILEAPPTEPSTAVTDAAAAEARATEPGRLRRRLRGDLDQIVLRALRKDPDRRYDGASALAADLARHRDGLPVEARPESAAYRAGRFVKRHRLAVGAAVLVMLAVVGGAGVAWWQAAEAEAARLRSDDRAAEAEAVTEFLIDMIGAARPSGSDGDTLSVRDVLDGAAARLDTSFADRPLVRARVALAVGQAFSRLGKAPASLGPFHEAVALRRAALGPGDTLTVAAEDWLGLALLNTRDLDGLDSLYLPALAVRRAAFGPGHPVVVEALTYLALGATRRADSVDQARAVGYYEEAIRLVDGEGAAAHRALLGSEAGYDEFRSSLYYGLAVHLLETGQKEQAVAPMERALDLAEAPDSFLLNGYGVLLRDLGRHEEALPVLKTALEVSERAYGPDHPLHGHVLLSLGTAHAVAGRPAEAVPILRNALRNFGGPEDEGRSALRVRYLLGTALLDAGEVEEGRATLQAALPGLERVFGSENRRVIGARARLDG